MTKMMKLKSQLVEHHANLEWEIENISVDKLLEGSNCSIKSPSFKCGRVNVHLEVSLKLKEIQLRVVQPDFDDSSWCTSCYIGFGPDRLDIETSKFCQPIKFSDIVHCTPIERIKNFNVTEKWLVIFELWTAILEHVSNAPSEAQITVHEKDNYLNQGSVTLSRHIESMFEYSRFSDVTLKVGHKDTFQAHKAILASRSKVFEAMFDSGMREGRENEVNLVEMKSETAKEMLHYIYTGNIQELSMNHAMDLYVAADRYDLQELKFWCKDFILRHISADDVCKVAELADLHSDEELDEASKRVFRLSSKSILTSEGWRDFAKKNPDVYANLVESAL